MADRAERFDRMIAPLEPGWMTPSRKWAADRALGDVLEVGVGTGATFEHYGDVRLTGVDIDGEMLGGARRHAAALGRDADLRLADGDDLPFDDAAFDAVVATFVLCEVGNVRRSVVEMLRVLRPGGRLLLADHVGSSNPLLYAGQWLVEKVTGPISSEHWTRRPLKTVESLAIPVAESWRRRAGIIENVHATKPQVAG